MLHPDVPNAFSIGSDKVASYHEFYNVEHPFKVDRSEKDISLKKILATTVDRKLELQKTINRAISLVEDDLNKSMNSAEVGEEIEKVIDVLNFKIQIPKLIPMPTLSKMNKVDRIKELIRVRKIYFEHDKDAESRDRDEVRKAFEERYPEFVDSNELANQIYNEKIYCLSDEVFNEARYS